MNRILILFFALVCAAGNAIAQQAASRYITGGDLVARFPTHFKNGFLFVSVPLQDTLRDGSKITVTKSFLIDPRASNDGSYLPADSLPATMLGTRTWMIPASPQRTLVWKLAPSLAKMRFKLADTAYGGVIGYGVLRQYVTVLDLVENTLSLYSLDPAPHFSERLNNDAVHVPYFDDVRLTYCHCEFPSIWVEADASPLNKGRWHLSLADRQSVVYQEALTGEMKKKINRAIIQDSIAGKPDPYAGITINNFTLGGKNLAPLEPKRPIDKTPDLFKDLTSTIMGTVAMDIIKHFHALIIDPTESKLMLCNY